MLLFLLRNVTESSCPNLTRADRSLAWRGISLVTLAVPFTQTAETPLIVSFFQRSVGQWHSERRYYTLPDGDTKEMVSHITVEFLEAGCSELQHLAELHELDDAAIMLCGTRVSWESRESVSGRKKSKGSTLFGASDQILYRDRGFATPKPVYAIYHFTNPDTLCLRTEYNDSSFEEELKLVGEQYRTRQTIISRAGEQQMIGQYLEKRV